MDRGQRRNQPEKENKSKKEKQACGGSWWEGSWSNVTSKAGKKKKTCGEIAMENSGGKTTNWHRKRIEHTGRRG